MHVISNDGRILFTGTKHACKQFIRKSNVKQYKLKTNFTEKVAVVETQPKAKPEPSPLSEPETPEGFFNRVFDE